LIGVYWVLAAKRTKESEALPKLPVKMALMQDNAFVLGDESI
jgi:hypothetical protein